MLSMEPALFTQSSSRAKVTGASHDLVCDPWSIHQPFPPFQTMALGSAVGVHIQRCGLLRHAAIFNITSQWQDPEILIYCYNSIWWKIGPHVETPCAQVSFWSTCPFKRYRGKRIPAKLKPTAGDAVSISGVNRDPKNLGPEKNVLTDSVIGRSVPKNSDTFRSVCLLRYVLFEICKFLPGQMKAI